MILMAGRPDCSDPGATRAVRIIRNCKQWLPFLLILKAALEGDRTDWDSTKWRWSGGVFSTPKIVFLGKEFFHPQFHPRANSICEDILRNVSSSKLLSSSGQEPCVYHQISAQCQDILSAQQVFNEWINEVNYLIVTLSFHSFLSYLPKTTPLVMCFLTCYVNTMKCALILPPQQGYSLKERFLRKNGYCWLANMGEIPRLKDFGVVFKRLKHQNF